jgi:hypothetical protein
MPIMALRHWCINCFILRKNKFGQFLAYGETDTKKSQNCFICTAMVIYTPIKNIILMEIKHKILVFLCEHLVHHVDKAGFRANLLEARKIYIFNYV